MRRAVLIALLCLAYFGARAQAPPAGVGVLNQALGARAVTKSDTTVIQTTRALFIGDAAACNIALILSGDSAAVTFSNVQPGEVLPFSAFKVMSTNTTCATIVALY